MRGRILVATTVLASMVSAAFAQRLPQPASLSETVSWSSGVAYAYDSSGNIVTAGADTYGYDGVGRLVRSTVNATERRYAYDAHGNMISCVQWPDTPSASPCTLAGYGVSAATNRLTAAVDSDSDPTNDTYDAAGNVVRLAGHTYTYDALDMQVSDSSALGEREYVYDADGERIAIHLLPANTPPPGQQKLGEWRWTFRDASGKVLREFRSQDTTTGMAGWTWVRDYVWRDGQLLASLHRNASGALVTYHYHLDHLGTPRRVTDDADRIVGVHDYHPFGVELSSSQDEPLGGSMRFTGHERDAFESDWATTLDYMHARFYSSAASRFLSVDPAMDIKANLPNPQRWNRYSYVSNNPINKTDPDGRDELALMDQLHAEQLAVAAGEMTRAEYRERNIGRGVGAAVGSASAAVWAFGPPSLAAATPQLMRWGMPLTPVFNMLRNIGAELTGQSSLPFGLSNKGLKHATAHLGEFQALDKSMTQTKLIGLAAQIASKAENYIGSPGNRRNYEQLVKIGEKVVRVRVVINESDNLRSVQIRY